MAQQLMGKLNANEKRVLSGALIVLVGYLVGLLSPYGFLISRSGALAAALAIAVIYWLKYQPSPIRWPAPPQTIVVVIAGVSAFFAVATVLDWLSAIANDLLSLFTIAVLLNAIGCGVMAFGAWTEYQATAKAATPRPPAPPAA